MSQLKILCGFLFIVVLFQEYSTQRTNRNRYGYVTRRIFVHEFLRATPEQREKLNRRLRLQRERNAQYRGSQVQSSARQYDAVPNGSDARRNREKGPRRQTPDPRTRQGPRKQPDTSEQKGGGYQAVRNREKGPRRRPSDPQTRQGPRRPPEQRGDGNQAVRNREKGPRRRTSDPRTRQGPRREPQSYQQRRDDASRNREKGPRREPQSYQQRRDDARRNREKGPRREPQSYQQRKGDATRNREKGPRRESQSYQQRRGDATRNREKGPRRTTQDRRGDTGDDPRRRTDSGRNGQTQDYQQRGAGASATRRREKGPRPNGGSTQQSRQSGSQATQTRSKGPRTSDQRYARKGDSGRVVTVTRTRTRTSSQRQTQGRQRTGQRNSVVNRGRDAERWEQLPKEGHEIPLWMYSQDANQNTQWSAKKIRVYQYGNVYSGNSSAEYNGCSDRGKYCNYWKSIGCCEKLVGRINCAKTCGFCSPLILVCPASYKYGCCWDGMPAADPQKSNCRRCKDRNSRICSNRGVYRGCDLNKSNCLITRYLCPQTCGACLDFSA